LKKSGQEAKNLWGKKVKRYSQAPRSEKAVKNNREKSAKEPRN
jgi:hypothetical protein